MRIHCIAFASPRKLLLYGYGPFFAVPFLMAVDGAIRLWKAIGHAESLVKVAKLE
jgi:hypothetical protein